MGQISVKIIPASGSILGERQQPLLDVDGNGKADALTDGVMLVRYLFGLRGPALIAGAVGSGATRPAFGQIEAWIQPLTQ